VIVQTADNIAADLLFPLNRFHESFDGLEVQRIEGEAVPEPYRSLLVHHNDMTPTLESFYGSQMRLKRLEYREEGEAVLRRVVLFDDRGRVVEYGAIHIELARFPARAQAMIREGRVPLGAIMHHHRIEHLSRPRGYFAVEAEDGLRDVLQFDGDATLYGRRNVIANHADQPLADVVEILPPMTG